MIEDRKQVKSEEGGGGRGIYMPRVCTVTHARTISLYTRLDISHFNS